MYNQIYWVIAMIIILMLLFQIDNFDGSIESNTNDKPINKVTGDKITYSERNLNKNKDYNLLDDPLFNDVVVYHNLEYPDGNVRMGLDLCLEKCNGNCIEFGVTGIGQCFPRDSKYQTNSHTIIPDERNPLRNFNNGSTAAMLQNSENITDDRDYDNTIQTFPGLR